MRKMAKFASLCLAATLSMTTVLTAIPQDARIVMAEESETDNRYVGNKDFQGRADDVNFKYSIDNKRLELTGTFNGGDVFDLLYDYIDFDNTQIDDIYVDFSITGSHVTFRTGVESNHNLKKVFNSITFGKNFQNTTGNLTDCSGMFKAGIENVDNIIQDRGFMNIDLSGWDTSNVTNMSDMFSGCGKLIKLDMSCFNTSKVTDMSGMFNSCKELTELNLSNFDTSNVTDMQTCLLGVKV